MVNKPDPENIASGVPTESPGSVETGSETTGEITLCTGKQIRELYGLPEAATEQELREAEEALVAKNVRERFGLRVTATE